MEGLAYLNSRAPWTGIGRFSLEPVQRLLAYWGNPQDKVPTIHIAGTNGKGSVSAFISSILAIDGHKVGLTTSPHLERINERVVIDGQQISDTLLNDYALELEQASKHLKDEISFFEAITCIYFKLACDVKVDWSIVEVGLGGRLDATNLIKNPACCVITTIDKDHEDQLGNTIAKIAFEKAGIFKANCPAVNGELKSEAQLVIEARAKELKCDFYQYQRDFILEEGNILNLKLKGQSNISVQPSLVGDYQLQNASVAIQAAKIVEASSKACEAGIRKAFWPGRLEWIESSQRKILLDAGHNPAGIAQLVDYIRKKCSSSVDIAFGVLATKRWKEMVEALIPVVSQWNLIAPPSAAAVSTKDTAEFLSSFGISARDFGTDYQRLITECTTHPDVRPLVVAGSIYLLGEIRHRLVNRAKPTSWRKSDA